MSENSYEKMWDDFGQAKFSYLGYKFTPTHRIGLTNYLRESLLLKFVDAQETDLVLDCGCAAGKQLFHLSAHIKEGYGVDISQAFVDMAEKYRADNNFTNLHFQQSGLETIPFADAFFDKVICAEVLEHVADKELALQSILRVLKSKGVLVITVPNLNADATWYGRLLRFLGLRQFKPMEVFDKTQLVKHGDAHVREFSHQDAAAWLQKNNLQIVEIKSVSFIDGPGWFQYLLKIPLRIKFLQKFIIYLEKVMTQSGSFWGRHLVIKAIKK